MKARALACDQFARIAELPEFAASWLAKLLILRRINIFENLHLSPRQSPELAAAFQSDKKWHWHNSAASMGRGKRRRRPGPCCLPTSSRAQRRTLPSKSR
jgi:hypothetical protein